VHPELLRFTVPWIGKEITIYSYGTVIVLAFLVAAWWTRRAAHRRLGLDKERVFNVAFALLFVGIAGARLLYALIHYQKFTARPMSFLFIWEGGLVWYGGLIADLLWLAWYLPRHPDLRGYEFTDVLVRGACLGIFLGRWASFLAGEGYGRPTDLPWGIPAVRMPQATESVRQSGQSILDVRLHPAQVYESLFGLLLFVVLGWLAKRGWRSGRLTAMFLMLYALGRPVLELFRWDDADRGMIGGHVSMSQLISVPVFFAGLALWLVRRPEHPVHRRPVGATA
jgi:phosphatidylglycerol---prolipoprotein diacylglyceryl transferase